MNIHFAPNQRIPLLSTICLLHTAKQIHKRRLQHATFKGPWPRSNSLVQLCRFKLDI